MSLWELAAEHGKRHRQEKGSKATRDLHIFTYDTTDVIMKSPYFLSYVAKQYKDDKTNLDAKKRELLENYELAVEANKRDEEAIKEMDPIEYEYSTVDYITFEEMQQKK